LVRFQKDFLVPLAIAIGLPGLAVWSARVDNLIGPICAILAFILFIVLSVVNRLPQRYFPYCVFGVSLALVWGTSLLGPHVIGSDIPRELYLSNYALGNGWTPDADWMNLGMSNMSAVVGWLIPLASKLTGISPLWFYKAVLPVMLAAVPLVLYYAYRRQFGDLRAFYAAMFFIAVPISSIGIVGIGKSMVAELFFALMILVMVSGWRWWVKGVAMMACMAIMVVSHYTIALIGFGYLMIIGVSLFGIDLLKRKLKLATMLYLVVIVVSLVFGNFYYSNYGGHSVYTSTSRIGGWALAMPGIASEYEGEIEIEPPAGGTQKSGDMQSSPDIFPQVKTLKTGSYLDGQSSLVKMALGLDFIGVSLWGKIFRILQIMSELAIMFGVCIVLWCRKKFHPAFVAGVLVSGFILMACILAPGFSRIINAGRFYHIALFFAAPLLVVGLGEVYHKYWQYIVGGFLVIYLVFTSGFIYEATGSEVTSYLDIPYSAPFSGERMGLVGIPEKGDLEAAEWLANKSNQDYPIVSDYNGVTLLASFIYPTPRIGKQIYKEPRLVQYIYRRLYDETILPERDCYVFVTSWNEVTGKVVAPAGPGLRYVMDMPSYVSKGKLVYDNGAKVYYFKGKSNE